MQGTLRLQAQQVLPQLQTTQIVLVQQTVQQVLQMPIMQLVQAQQMQLHIQMSLAALYFLTVMVL